MHLGAGELELVRWSADLESRRLPESPFLLLGQMTTADASRSPAGTESAWGYTHLPRGMADDESADELARRAERVLEEFAPGFGDRVLHRDVQRPSDCRRRTLTSGRARSTAAPPSCSSSSSSAPSRGSDAPQLPSRACTSPVRRRTRAAGCTGSAAGLPPGPRSVTTAFRASRAGGC